MRYKIWIRLIAIVAFISEVFFLKDLIRMPFSCFEELGKIECMFWHKFSVAFWSLVGSFGLFFITTNFTSNHKWLGVIIYLPVIIAFPFSVAVSEAWFIIIPTLLLSLATPIYFIFSKNQVYIK